MESTTTANQYHARRRRKPAYVPDDPLLDACEAAAETGRATVDILARRARRPAATPVSRHAEVPSLAAFGIAGCGGRLPRACQERSVMGFPLPMSEPLARAS